MSIAPRSLAEARVDGIVWVATSKPLAQTLIWLQSIAHVQLIRKCWGSILISQRENCAI